MILLSAKTTIQDEMIKTMIVTRRVQIGVLYTFANAFSHLTRVAQRRHFGSTRPVHVLRESVQESTNNFNVYKTLTSTHANKLVIYITVRLR